jgi:PBP1b-binding outer membrane lipoprotein LpoB
MKHSHFIFFIVAIAMILMGCSSKKEEKPSPLVDKAIEVATQAAKTLVGTDHGDTLAMQSAILEAKALQAEFQVAEDTAAINTYNRTFKKYLQQYDPELAKEIFIERPKNLPADEPWDEFEQFVEDPYEK